MYPPLVDQRPLGRPEADNGQAMGDFIVREWLAARLHCEADQLDLAGPPRPTNRGQEGRYDLDGGDMAVVLITWPMPAFRAGARRMIDATLPRGRALIDIDAKDRVVW